MNITACVFRLGDTTYCCGAFTRSATTSCVWGLGHLLWRFRTVGDDRLHVLGPGRCVVVRSHSQRLQPPCLGTWTLLWRVHTIRDDRLRVLGRGFCCGVFTRAEVYRVHRRVKEDESVKVACEENAAGSANFSFLLLHFSTSWVLRLLTSFSTWSLGTHKRWWRRGRRKSLGLDPIFWGFSEDTHSLRSMTSQRSAAVARRLHQYLVISAVGFLLVSLACVCVERQFWRCKD